MKLLVLLLVLAIAVGWLMLRTRRKPPPVVKPPSAPPEVSQMLACAHCGVHLPRAEAAFDVGGRAYCGAEHRVAGPR